MKPVRDRGRQIPSRTRTALDHRPPAPTRNRPATVSTVKHSLLTYLLRYFSTGADCDADELIAEMEFGAEIACKSVYAGSTHKLLSVAHDSWWEDCRVTSTHDDYIVHANTITWVHLIVRHAQFVISCAHVCENINLAKSRTCVCV